MKKIKGTEIRKGDYIKIRYTSDKIKDAHRIYLALESWNGNDNPDRVLFKCIKENMEMKVSYGIGDVYKWRVDKDMKIYKLNKKEAEHLWLYEI